MSYIREGIPLRCAKVAPRQVPPPVHLDRWFDQIAKECRTFLDSDGEVILLDITRIYAG